MARIVPRIVSLFSVPACAIVLAVSAAPNSVGAAGLDQQIAGKRLVLKDNADTSRRRMSALSHDPTITLGDGNGSADDPTQFGGSLRIRTGTGDRFDSTYVLPSAGWTTIGTPGQNRGYQFTSTTGPRCLANHSAVRCWSAHVKPSFAYCVNSTS